jgi:hypothetical protein
MALLGPLEEAYVKSIQQQKALAQQRQSQQAGAASHSPTDSGMTGSSVQTSQTAALSKSQSIVMLPLHSQSETASGGASNPEPSSVSSQAQGLDLKGNQQLSSDNHGLQKMSSTLLSDAPQTLNDTNSCLARADNGSPAVSINNAISDMDDKKRKLQEDDSTKRVRQRTGVLLGDFIIHCVINSLERLVRIRPAKRSIKSVASCFS